MQRRLLRLLHVIFNAGSIDAAEAARRAGFPETARILEQADEKIHRRLAAFGTSTGTEVSMMGNSTSRSSASASFSRKIVSEAAAEPSASTHTGTLIQILREI